MNHRGPVNYVKSDRSKFAFIGDLYANVSAKFESRLYWLRWKRHLANGKAQRIDQSKIRAGSIPIVINNFNRVEPLTQLVDWLLRLDQPVSIIIVDNLSTYQPLLDWYNDLAAPNIQVLKLDFNSGLWGLGYVTKQLPSNLHYVVTDSDLVPFPDTPADLLGQMKSFLDQDQALNHVGVSIEIDDLPVESPLRESVQEWEAQFWRKQYTSAHANLVPAFIAPVDTTFAMYRPLSDVKEVYRSLRLDRPYTLKHVDWYEEPDKFSEEYAFYLAHCGPIASWAQMWQKVAGKKKEVG